VTALETGWMEFDGELLKQPRVEIRPRPVKSWRNRVFASAISPDSIGQMARLGVGLLYNPQKPWDKVNEDLEGYREEFRSINNSEPPKPLIGILVCVHRDAEKAQYMRDTYLQRYARSTVEHYQFDNVAFEEITGYEYYGALARNIERHGLEKFNAFLADLQVWGTPEQVTEQLLDVVKKTNAGGLLVSLAMGGMPPAEAVEAFELFASDVLPALQAHDVGGDLGVTYEADQPQESKA
jgi:alkanesulfonate monooxygenase SsuD/methylene tetrahydromethanopterin reductase-like flavin-dependent oxidoreductase (luciferase family)